jgi:hypothetical protein
MPKNQFFSNVKTKVLFSLIAILFSETDPLMADDTVIPTYSGSIASLLHSRCSNCHRPGQSGPFTLLTYDDAKEHSQTIAAVVTNGYMPPWKPIDHGIDFANDRKLTSKERNDLLRWIEGNCPIGEEKSIPTAPAFYEGWSLGKPDLIVKLDRPFPVLADGPDQYRSFAFPVGMPEDHWIKAIEVRPTARGVVHHALFFVDVGGNAKKQKSRDGLPGFVGMNFLRGNGNMLERVPESMARGLGGYVPGAMPNRLPGDLARLLPKGSDIVMQTHFHPTGKAESEQTELGIYFADKPPQQQLVPVQIPPLFGMGAGIDIPAGKKDFVIRASYRLPIAIRGIEIGGHAHYLCTKMSMVAKLPDQGKLDLLEINDWDLDWQDQYVFAKPIDLPQGTQLEVEIHYDNSEDNPENPFSPPQHIAWGRESTDEMGSITLLAIAADESERDVLEKEIRANTRSGLANRIRAQMGLLGGFGGTAIGDRLLGAMDKNRDGNLDREELPAKFRERLLDLFDDDGDEAISPSEVKAGRENLREFLGDNRRRSERTTDGINDRPESKPIDYTQVVDAKMIEGQLSDLKANVLVFTRTDCPIANEYQPKLQRLHEEFGDRFEWVLVYSQPSANAEDIEQHGKEYRVDYKRAIDVDFAVAKRFGAKVTPQAIVVSPQGEVLYSGRIDDLYEDFGKKRRVITRDDLRLALQEIAANKPVSHPEFPAIGCILPKE